MEPLATWAGLGIWAVKCEVVSEQRILFMAAISAVTALLGSSGNGGTRAPASRTFCVLPRAASSGRLPLWTPSSLRPTKIPFSPPLNKPPGLRRGVRVVSMATEEPFDVNKVVTEALESLKEAWEKTEDKLAFGSLGFAAFLTLWASTGVVSAIDKLPLVPTFFELVGALYSTWFVYRYLLFKPDREEFLSKMDSILNEITGSDSRE